jgi:glyoxylase I family protein
VDNIEECVQQLKDNGISIEPVRIDEFTGKKFTFMPDPDNLPIEIYEI